MFAQKIFKEPRNVANLLLPGNYKKECCTCNSTLVLGWKESLASKGDHRMDSGSLSKSVKAKIRRNKCTLAAIVIFISNP